MRSYKSGVYVALSLAVPVAVHAQAVDPAQAPVQALCDKLIAIMKSGKQAGQQGRAAALAPTIDKVFDVPLMTRLTVGPSWTTLSSADQAALTTAFRRMTIAQYAANFDSFGGEKFTMDPKVEARGTDRLVRTKLLPASGQPESLAYRLRQSGGEWKIIDVFYRDSISQLATRRSDFSRVLATGGAKALVRHLDDLADRPTR
ncbi:ABC transporter substrate-binding protein [Flavisphingomonas formosensis]|uniref:ABC transporter substrate-binding protein n=1 Tax=Flavisphingomonas formosensis TaxID=861534 RepID=UPI0012F9C64E|nr:ABC transporter substrate-binding protein [Sphingomonas formosensis]